MTSKGVSSLWSETLSQTSSETSTLFDGFSNHYKQQGVYRTQVDSSCLRKDVRSGDSPYTMAAT